MTDEEVAENRRWAAAWAEDAMTYPVSGLGVTWQWYIDTAPPRHPWPEPSGRPSSYRLPEPEVITPT